MKTNKSEQSTMYVVTYESPYEINGSFIFDDYNRAVYWFNEFYRAGNVRATLIKLCKTHSRIGESHRHGKCCKVLDNC